ncbi:hypothetical protein ACFFX1_43105 [Dactylosporangium sucinum]|uniref:Uncharacterized protein n=1 Tax=Dactylosporangium sucinum TaxID=1424081 RepID=A0A917TYZ4_9ACTN|nr:hypothetical protein [Dactylosporangium sucinum]GGM45150.1 hypothetical protein GCM10007977_053360 [Dactylosporangium sucinum]
MSVDRNATVLGGLARNPALPPDLFDALLATAAEELAERADLTAGQVRALVARGGAGPAIRLVRRGLLHRENVAGAAAANPGLPRPAMVAYLAR